MSAKMSSSIILRFSAIGVFVLGIVVGGAQVIRAVRLQPAPGEDISAARTPLVLEGLFIAGQLVGLSALLHGVGLIVKRQGAVGASMAQATSQMLESLENVRSASEHAAAQMLNLYHTEHSGAPPSAQGGAGPEIPAQLTEAIGRMTAVLEEMRELSMMSDEQRQARLARQHEHGKRQRIETAAAHLRARQWARAGDDIELLSIDFPAEQAVTQLRQQLEAGRNADVAKMVAAARERIEDFMAVSNWEEAYGAAYELSEDFPNDPDARALLDRVTRERDVFSESTSHRLYEEIKDDIERRRWRRALTNSRRLLDKFPEHRKADKIRGQLQTIQDNAEIQERQEHETRIEELIRAKRFAEAIELAEDVLDRFPNSPQAESLEQLLPKMRDLAMKQEVEELTL